MSKLKLLFTILDEDYDREIKQIYNKNNLSVRFLTHGYGTASSSVLDYFGLIETKKHIHIAVIADYLEDRIINQIDKKIHLNEPGTGIVFTISLASANKFLLDEFNEKEVSTMNSNSKEGKKYLIITIVLEGHLEQVMSAAKKEGVTGGTVIRGIGLGDKSAVKFLGFEIEPGRELVLNIVDSAIKNKVMESINKEVGIKTSAMGICLAIPVDKVVGMHLEQE